MVSVEDIRMEVLRWALANAVAHGGRGDAKSVMGKIISEFPGWKTKISELKAIVDEIVAEVNSLSLEEQKIKIEEVGKVEIQKKEKVRGLPELPGVESGKAVVTRFAPNPNGPIHLGNIRAAILSHEYAKKYGGKFILRFEDTNPENVLLEMYELIKRDLRWLGLSWDEEHVQSDRMQIYYDRCEWLLREGKAYVCICPVEDFRFHRDHGESCPCRGLSPTTHLERWRRMIAGDYDEGVAVVRVKTDLNHPNPAVRDWPALRVVKKPHPRVGTRFPVWPLYNFSVSIDDHEMGVTHILRGKEHEVNEERQRTLYAHFGWKYPVAIQYGRLNVPGAPLSKSQIVREIKEGKISGHDDVRLATVSALRRRGISPEAIRQLILDVGITLVDSSISWENLYSYNRKILDKTAGRYFFVGNPRKLVVSGFPAIREVKLHLHPSNPEAGERVVPLEVDDGKVIFHVPWDDVKDLKEGDLFRLKDLMNVRLKKKAEILEGEFFGLGVIDVPKFQWVSKAALPMEILFPDGASCRGLVEPAVAGLEPGTVVQFERFGFVRIETITPEVKGIYAHR
ncbi:MAG: glutamate--tRNA ligase [Candidatus Hadarchaeales archaeon]